MGNPVEDIYKDAPQADPGSSVDPKGMVVEEPDGKYLLIGVDDFDEGMSSYLRLGAAATSAGVMPSHPSHTGEDLAALIQGFADDFRDHGKETPDRKPNDPTLPPIQTGLNEETLGDGQVLVEKDAHGHGPRRCSCRR